MNYNFDYKLLFCKRQHEEKIQGNSNESVRVVGYSWEVTACTCIWLYIVVLI
jgi:hypothetical protein